MKNKLIIIITIFITILILVNFNTSISSIKDCYNLVMHNIFPSIIPFLIISNILISYGIEEDCLFFFNKFTTKLFNINGMSAYVFIMSFLTGSPANAKYIKDLYDNDLLSINGVNKILLSTHFFNPIFVLNISLIAFNNKKIGFLIILTTLITNIITAFIYRNKYKDCCIRTYKSKDKKTFLNILNNSIISIFNTLILILGIITIITVLLNIILKYITINSYIESIITGLIEITNGTNKIKLLNIPINQKILIFTFFINFGGFSVHAQCFNILNNQKISYKAYLQSRLISAIIASIIMYFLI